MDNYSVYNKKLNTNEEYRIELSNNNTKPVQIVVKYVSNIKEVINNNITINKKDPNTCYIIIDYKDYKKTKEIITASWREHLSKTPLNNNIKVLYSNETEKEIADYIQKSMNNVIIEDANANNIKEEFNKFLSARTITKIDNGIIRNYVERKSDIFSTGYMLEGIAPEEMYNIYNELLNDTNKKEMFSTMNQEEIANYVLDYIANTGNYKKYYLESAREQTATDTRGAVASAVAENHNGVVNKETGIVVNDPSKSTEINTVEKNGNKVNVIEPEVNRQNISPSNPDTSNSYSFNHSSTNEYYGEYNNQGNNYSNGDNSEYSDEGKITEDEEQNRKQVNDNVYVKKKVLSNPYGGIEQPRGIITVPTIIFILSGLLLIASLILFIISK